MSERRGISVHIGVNRVNGDHYAGWEGPLASCENDADTMHAIARARGFEASVMKTQDATRDAVKQAILNAAASLTGGDIFLATYAGHGGRVRDITGEERDKKDDTWCLWDGQLLDDELNVMFSEFAEGVRVLILSDSCHSGTLLKGRSDAGNPPEFVDDFVYSRAMPRKAQIDAYKANVSFYSQIQEELPDPRPEIRASVRLLSGCLEHQESFGNKEFGRFTNAVKTVFADGAYQGDYKSFHREIVAAVARAMNPQTPGHSVIGRSDPDFDGQAPFTI